MSSRDLAELRRRHTEIRVRMVQINDAHPDGSLGDDGAEWTTLDGEVGQIEGAITRQARLDDLERRSAAVPADGGTGDAGFDRLLAQTTFADVVRAQMPGVSDAGAGRAIECSQELARRNGTKPEGLLFSLRGGTALPGMVERRVGQTSSVNALGGFLIEEEIQPPIDRLRERTIVRKLGATVLGGLQGDLQIPRLTGSSTTGWVGDGQALTPSNLTFDNIGLFAKHCGGLLSMSRGMILQPSVDVARMMTDDLTKVLAVTLDQAGINGSGSNAQPHGLLGNSDVANTYDSGGNGGAPTWDRIVGAIASVDQSNALEGSLGWATNAKVVSKLRRTLKTTSDTSSNFLMTDPNSLAGYPLMSSQVVPSNLVRGSSGAICSPLIFGDWSSLILAFWSEIDVLVNPYDSVAYAAGSVLIRAMMTCDVNVRHGAAFGVLADLLTT